MNRYVSIATAVILITASGFAFACSQTAKFGGGGKSSGPDHNIGIYEYSPSTDEWVLVDSWHDPAVSFAVGPDDYIYTEQGWSNFIVFTNSAPSSSPPDPGGGGAPPGGGGLPPGGGGAHDPKSGAYFDNKKPSESAKCHDVKELDRINVSGTSISLRNWLGGVSTAWAIIGTFGGGGGGGGVSEPPTPPEPPECNTGDPEIDDTADLREELMDASLLDPDNPIETGGLFWPDGNGNYELLEFGIDIPGGRADGCSITLPPVSAFPPANEWPAGVILFHTHPYTPLDYAQACNRTYLYGASDADRSALAFYRGRFREDLQGMILDKHNIYKYGETRREDEGRIRRCK